MRVREKRAEEGGVSTGRISWSKKNRAKAAVAGRASYTFIAVALDAAQPRLTLVTCYPFDAVVPGGPLRLVVTADPQRAATET